MKLAIKNGSQVEVNVNDYVCVTYHNGNSAMYSGEIQDMGENFVLVKLDNQGGYRRMKSEKITELLVN